jgi:ADP-ribosylglycohydrolase
VLLGLAAGDQIGGPIRMAVRLAQSLVQFNNFNPDDVLCRYLQWHREGAFDTGPTSNRALSLIQEGNSVHDAVAQTHREFGGRTAGCNPAHRSSPLSMQLSIADEDLAGCAMTEAASTHHDTLAGEVAAVVNRLCRALIRGTAWDNAVQNCGQFRKISGPGHNGGFAPDVLRAALHFIGTSSDFVDALDRSLAFAGPANYCPVLVGSIGGARWGASAIPSSRLKHVEINAVVGTTADALSSKWKTKF